jgi:hypothetical protein
MRACGVTRELDACCGGFYKGAFPEVPYPNAEGVKTLLDDITPRTPKRQPPTQKVSSI